jgi:hypothetical protein
MDQREAAAGLYNTTSGRDFFGAESGEAPSNAAENVDTFYDFGAVGAAPQPSSVQENYTGGEAGVETSGAQPIDVIFCVNGTPYNGYVLGQIGGLVLSELI